MCRSPGRTNHSVCEAHTDATAASSGLPATMHTDFHERQSPHQGPRQVTYTHEQLYYARIVLRNPTDRYNAPLGTRTEPEGLQR